MPPLGTARLDTLQDLAVFCSALIREGIAFTVRADGTRWLVEMTGY